MNDTAKVLIDRIISLGPTDKARAQALGVSMRTVTDYKAGKIPRIVLSLLDQGILSVPVTHSNDERGKE